MGFRLLALALCLVVIAGCGGDEGIDPTVKAADFRFADTSRPRTASGSWPRSTRSAPRRAS